MTGALDHDRMLDVLEAEGTLLAATADTADPTLPVPSCPGLTVGETTRHVGSIHRRALRWIRTGTRPLTWRRDPEPGQSAADYLRDGLRSLLGELAAHPPAEPCATWHPSQANYGFWRRRMAHETTIHRCDVQSAVGPVAPVADDVAVDGIDEVLTLWFGHRLTVLGVAGTRRGTLAVRSGDRVWLATVGQESTVAVPATAADVRKASAVVTGEPADLYLWLWGRLPFFAGERITQSGDQDLCAQAWALLRLATR